MMQIVKDIILYAYHAGNIYKDKSLTAKNGSGQAIKKEKSKITKDINYIFYRSLALDKNYHFYLTDSSGSQQEYSFTFGTPEGGEDDEDVHDK